MKDEIAQKIVKITKNYKGEMKLPCVFDRALRNKKVVNELLKYLEEDIKEGRINRNIKIICSGKFGEIVQKLSTYPVILLEGSLRWKDVPEPVLIENPGKCVFIDDGIYTCRTYTKIRSAVDKAGGEMIGAYFGYKAGNPYYEIYMRSICTAEDVRRYSNDY